MVWGSGVHIMVYTGVIYRGYMGIMEKKMETTIIGYIMGLCIGVASSIVTVIIIISTIIITIPVITI